MPENHEARDPIDAAYVQAEALLDDEAARAERRARMLAAIASGPAASASPPAARAPRSGWRSGRWLAAAAVAGLAVLVATHVYQPPVTPESASRPGAVTSSAPPAPLSTAPPSAGAARSLPAPAAPTPIALPNPRNVATASPPQVALAAPPPPPPSPPPPPPAPEAFPAAPPPPPPPPGEQAVVTAEKRAPALAQSDQSNAAGAESRAFAAPPAAEKAFVGPSDAPERLRAAAAAGRTIEVEDLLAGGVPVDASDAEGDTALMQSIQADHPATAALLRRHGASLDRRNRQGESARDMARDRGDADLDRAIGVRPPATAPREGTSP
ncbi:MAG TPA: ankyrin repeat domain-containing protein [Caulobacteraceae bacterium]|nr:ankyrin repeat domain-containing protein [Caulobacteraceae bacterium]